MKRTESNRKYLALFCAVLAALIVAAVTVCAVTVQRGESIAKAEADRYLTELSKQTTYKVDQRMAYNLELLGLLREELAIDGESEAGRAASVAAFVDNGPFAWIGTVDAEGVLRVEGREPKDAAGYDCVVRALDGAAGVSEDLVAVFGDEGGALYAVPAAGEPAAEAVVGWVPPDRMRLLLNTDTSDGVGFSHVVAGNGDFILKSSNENAILEGDNLFSALATQVVFEEGSLSGMQRDMEVGASGQIRFVSGDQVREMSYAPLDQGGWYLVSVVPPDLYSSSLGEFTAYSVGGMAIIALVAFAAFGGLLLWLSNKKNREIEHVAYVDPVTGGHTVARFDQLVQARIGEGKPFTFVSLDIKNFKLVNDFFGRQKGDLTLKYIHKVLREQTPRQGIVARVSSDVFNVMLDETDRDKVVSWLDRVAEKANEFNRLGERPYLLTINCGAYTVEDSASDIVTIRDRANTARKAAAEASAVTKSISFYSDPDFERVLREKELENRMDDALANGEFVAFLQPKVDLETGRTIGAEALVRWISADLGLIPPDDFIPFFERNGFVVKVDLCVFEQACRFVRSWIDRGIEPVPVSVNLSPVHLQIPDFLDSFEEIRARYDVPPEFLELELTERVAFENLELLSRVVDDIHERGFVCSMDDFGSGYSSLNVIKDIPVDTLKIDRAFFVKDDERARDVVASVVELAKKLDMGTVAEGIETIPQVEVLRATRCDAVQGYVFFAPMPLEDFERTVLGEGGRG